MKLKMLLVLLFVFSGVSETIAQSKEEITVYVTRTGAKYHDDGCRYLSKSKIAMKISEAASRYSPCSVCSPPVVESKSQVIPKSTPTQKQEASSGRCQATTKKGTQCSRKAKAGLNYCWQHG